jgi:hypothetical protein
MIVLKLNLPGKVLIQSVSITRPGGKWRQPNGDKGVIFVLGRAVVIGERYFYPVDRFVLNGVISVEKRILRVLSFPGMIECRGGMVEERDPKSQWAFGTRTVYCSSATINIPLLQRQLPDNNKEGADDCKIFKALRNVMGKSYEGMSDIWTAIKEQMRAVLVEMLDEKTKQDLKYYINP